MPRWGNYNKTMPGQSRSASRRTGKSFLPSPSLSRSNVSIVTQCPKCHKKFRAGRMRRAAGPLPPVQGGVQDRAGRQTAPATPAAGSDKTKSARNAGFWLRQRQGRARVRSQPRSDEHRGGHDHPQVAGLGQWQQRQRRGSGAGSRYNREQAGPPLCATSSVDRAEWYVQTAEGAEYGPVTRKELDAWVVEERIDVDCQLLQDGWDQWKWAEEVYPQLKSVGWSVEVDNNAATTPAGIAIVTDAVRTPAPVEAADGDAEVSAPWCKRSWGRGRGFCSLPSRRSSAPGCRACR